MEDSEEEEGGEGRGYEGERKGTDSALYCLCMKRYDGRVEAGEVDDSGGVGKLVWIG